MKLWLSVPMWTGPRLPRASRALASSALVEEVVCPDECTNALSPPWVSSKMAKLASASVAGRLLRLLPGCQAAAAPRLKHGSVGWVSVPSV